MPYSILLSTIIQASKSSYDQLSFDKRLYDGVMQDLVDDEVLSHFEVEPRRTGSTISDWHYTLYPTEKFSKQTASNNKVASKTYQKYIDP